MIRILIDKDNTVYDLHGPWLSLYNAANPKNQITKDMLTTWEMSYDIYKYLANPFVYSSGDVIENSIAVTQEWINTGYELAFVTAISHHNGATASLQWLNTMFPHIPNVIMIAGGHIKHWVQGDFLIDDGLHNHEQFEGISIVFDQPWNREANILRAYNWQQVEKIVERGVELLQDYSHEIVQHVLQYEQTKGYL